MTTKTIVRPDLDIKKITERLEMNLHDALSQVDRVDQREATGHELRETDVSVRRSCRALASDCRDALHRISMGTYGLCLQCDEPIDDERLHQFPYAPLCIDCKKGAPKISGEGTSTGNGEGSGPAGTPVVNAAADPSSEPTTETSVPASAPTEPSSTSPQSPPARPAGAEVSKQFGDVVIPGANRGGSVDSLPVTKIKPSSKNPRADVGDVAELAASIAAIGLLQPLVVVKNGNGYDLVAGHRRLAAVKQLDWQEVPVVVFNMGEREQLEARLIENIHREDLSALEEAKALQQLIEIHGMSQRELSDRIGRSQSHISKRIQLMDLPEKAAELVDSGGITFQDAQTILKLKDHPKRMAQVASHVDPSSYWTVERLVAEQERQIRDEAKAQKLRQKAKDDGLKIMAPNTYSNVDYNKKAEIGTGYNKLNIDLKEHRLEECHRVVISTTGSPRALQVCIDVARHSKSGKSKLKAKKADGSTGQGSMPHNTQAIERQKRRDGFRKVASARRKFVQGLLAKKVTQSEALDLVALAVGLGSPNELPGPDALCEAFGKKEALYPRDVEGRSPADRKLSEIASEPSNKPKLVMAAALHLLESELGYVSDNGDDSLEDARAWLNVVPYLEWLEGKGYTISELELESIGNAAKAMEETKAVATSKKSPAKKKGAAA